MVKTSKAPYPDPDADPEDEGDGDDDDDYMGADGDFGLGDEDEEDDEDMEYAYSAEGYEEQDKEAQEPEEVRSQGGGSRQTPSFSVPSASSISAPPPTIPDPPKRKPRQSKQSRSTRPRRQRRSADDGDDDLDMMPGHLLVEPNDAGPPAARPSRSQIADMIEARMKAAKEKEEMEARERGSVAASSSNLRAPVLSSPSAPSPVVPKASTSGPSPAPPKPTSTLSSKLSKRSAEPPKTLEEMASSELETIVQTRIISGNVQSWALETVNILDKVLSNLSSNPSEPKFKTLKLTNPKVKKHITDCRPPGGLEYLIRCGFKITVQDQVPSLQFPDEPTQRQLEDLNLGLRIVKRVISSLEDKNKLEVERAERRKKEEEERARLAMLRFDEDRRTRKEKDERESTARKEREEKERGRKDTERLQRQVDEE